MSSYKQSATLWLGQHLSNRYLVIPFLPLPASEVNVFALTNTDSVIVNFEQDEMVVASVNTT
jgi:hypothetical protein